MKKYDKYKYSKVEWIGNVPNEWDVSNISSISSLVSEKGYPDEELLSVYRDYGVIIKSSRDDNNNKAGNDLSAYKFVKKGYLVINKMKAWQGSLGISKYQGIVSPAYITCKINENLINTDYLHYLLRSNNYINRYNQLSYGIRVSQWDMRYHDFKYVDLLIPNKSEQVQIVNFIIHKTKAIDNKIELFSKKISYYKEYRKSLINDVVSKGLKKNDKLIHSELGFEINSKYTLFRLKNLGYLYSGLSGKSANDFNQSENESNKSFIPFTNIANNIYLKKDHLGTVVIDENENHNKVQKGDIFFLMSSEGYEDIGKSAILDDDLEETYLNSFCKGYRVTNKKANPYFLNYLLLSDSYRKQLTIEGKGFTRINLKMEKVNDFKVYLPNSIDEQIKIVEFLDQKTQTIDNIVININKQIEALKELRKTLINDVVTGKIKVI